MNLSKQGERLELSNYHCFLLATKKLSDRVVHINVNQFLLLQDFNSGSFMFRVLIKYPNINIMERKRVIFSF